MKPSCIRRCGNCFYFNQEGESCGTCNAEQGSGKNNAPMNVKSDTQLGCVFHKFGGE